MEWIPKALSSRNSVSPDALKICGLCGALNHEANHECFTCRWRGLFDRDPATIALAWQRLVHQHEGVLLEHVTARSTAIVDEFGRPRQTNGLQRLAGSLQNWWKGTLNVRRARPASKTEAPQPAAPKTDA